MLRLALIRLQVHARDAATNPRVQVGTRWVFWAMLLATTTIAPASEYSTHVTSYLKEMKAGAAEKVQGFVCLQARRGSREARQEAGREAAVM